MASKRAVTQKELALWLHMAVLELRNGKLTGEAGTYAKRLLDKGYDTVQGVAKLHVSDLLDAGMRKGDAELLVGRVSQNSTSHGDDNSSNNAEPDQLISGVCRYDKFDLDGGHVRDCSAEDKFRGCSECD